MTHYKEFYKIVIETTNGELHESPEYKNGKEFYGYIPPRVRLSKTLQEIGRNGGFYINKKTLTANPVKRVYVKTRTGY